MLLNDSKRKVAIITAVILITSLFPTSVFADENTKETAIIVKEGQTDKYIQQNGMSEQEEAINETERWYKFVPSQTSYYDISLTEKNSKPRALFIFVENQNGETIDSFYNKDESSVAKTTSYLTKNTTYYIICNNYWLENEYSEEAGTTFSTNFDFSIKKHNHRFTTQKTKDGNAIYVENTCQDCDHFESKTYYAPQNAVLSKTSFTYNGKVQKPTVTVKDAAGKNIDKQYYSVNYSASSKAIGKYSVTVKFTGVYASFKAITKTYSIIPPAPKLGKPSAIKTGFSLKWTQGNKKLVNGYEIQYSTKSNMKGAKTININTGSADKKTKTGLKKNKKYYIRIRSFKTVKGKKIYSNWSAVKNVKTK